MMVARVVSGLGVSVGSLIIGWWLGQRGLLTEPRARRVVLWTIWLSPLTACLSFWQLELSDPRVFALPLIGGALCVGALPPAWWYARRAKLPGPQAGAFLVCAMFSNVGFIGAFTAFALFGEAGYGLAMLYLVYFSPCYYLIGFAIARRFGHRLTEGEPDGAPSAELRALYFLGLLAGLGLSLARVPRPAALQLANHLLIPATTAVYLAAVGSQIRVEPFGLSLRPGLAMSAIKFVYTPLIAWLLVWGCHLEGPVRFVVLLQAAMPVAISPLTLPMLFGLDRRLTNALWLCTTLLAIPWLLLYLPVLLR